jgi:hypothetical protein
MTFKIRWNIGGGDLEAGVILPGLMKLLPNQLFGGSIIMHLVGSRGMQLTFEQVPI